MLWHRFLSFFCLVAVFACLSADAVIAPSRQSAQNSVPRAAQTAAAVSKGRLKVAVSEKTAQSSKKKELQGGVVAKSVLSPASTAKPYSPYSTNLQGTSSATLSDALPSSFGNEWTNEILTFAANNVLNSSDPANAQSPSVTSDAVLSFLESKGITIATAAKTEIQNEVNSMVNAYNDRTGLVNGAPLARIFAIQIMVMKNKATGQLVYPEAFPQDMLGKSYEDDYLSSWKSATSGKTYTLAANYIFTSISYTASNVIWEDPEITPYAHTETKEGKDELIPGLYSLDQIEQYQLSQMSTAKGEINSLNLIGITQRAYVIETSLPSFKDNDKNDFEEPAKINPPSMSIDGGFEESTGNDGSSDETPGGVGAIKIVKSGTSVKAQFTVDVDEDASGFTASLTIYGSSDASIDEKDLVAYLPGSRNFDTDTAYWNVSTLSMFVNISLSKSNGAQTLSIAWDNNDVPPDIGDMTLGPITFTVPISVTANSGSDMAEVCSVAQGSVSFYQGLLEGMQIGGKSNTWCFAISSISSSSPVPDSLSPSSSSSVSVIVPGWAFQYNGDVTTTLWSMIEGKKTSLSDYEAFQSSLPELDSYSVDPQAVAVTDLTTHEDVTSDFSSSYTPFSSYDTGFPYSGPQSYGGYLLTSPSLTVSWNGDWEGSKVENSGLWGYESTPIGYDMFEITFSVKFESGTGGGIYLQSATSSPASSFSSAVQFISTLSASAPAPVLSAAGIKGTDGKLESSNVTATLGAPMEFEAEAPFPSASQISAMSSASYSLVFYSHDAHSNTESIDDASICGIPFNSLPFSEAYSENGSVALLLTPQDLTYIADHASDPSKLLYAYDWYVTSSPSEAVSEIGYIKGTSLSSAAQEGGEPRFVSSSPALTLTVNSNGTAPLTPSAQESSAETGIWFQNRLLNGKDAKGAEFTVQNAEGQYLAFSSSSSEDTPSYFYSSSPYDFSSDNGDGLFRIWGLADGTYTVKEVKLPQGAVGAMPSFKVTLDYASGKPSSISDPDPYSLANEGAFVIFNQVSQEAPLPVTGGKLRIVLFLAVLFILLSLAGYGIYRYRVRN